MKIYETKEVRRKESRLAKMVCDLCGASTPYDDSWTTHNYHVQETEVYFKEGEQYPESGSGVEYRVDICPKCFKEKLIPWLVSQGCTAEMERWEW
jgi:hypothetical protein